MASEAFHIISGSSCDTTKVQSDWMIVILKLKRCCLRVSSERHESPAFRKKIRLNYQFKLTSKEENTGRKIFVSHCHLKFSMENNARWCLSVKEGRLSLGKDVQKWGGMTYLDGTMIEWNLERKVRVTFWSRLGSKADRSGIIEAFGGYPGHGL